VGFYIRGHKLKVSNRLRKNYIKRCDIDMKKENLLKSILKKNNNNEKKKKVHRGNE
jgi:hypothetical protein